MSGFNTPLLDTQTSDEMPVGPNISEEDYEKLSQKISQMEPSELIKLMKSYVEELKIKIKRFADEIANTQNEIDDTEKKIAELESEQVESAPPEKKYTFFKRFTRNVRKAFLPYRTRDGRFVELQIPIVYYLTRNLLYYPLTGVKNKKGGTKRRYRIKNRGTRRR